MLARVSKQPEKPRNPIQELLKMEKRLGEIEAKLDNITRVITTTLVTLLNHHSFCTAAFPYRQEMPSYDPTLVNAPEGPDA